MCPSLYHWILGCGKGLELQLHKSKLIFVQCDILILFYIYTEIYNTYSNKELQILSRDLKNGLVTSQPCVLHDFIYYFIIINIIIHYLYSSSYSQNAAQSDYTNKVANKDPSGLNYSKISNAQTPQIIFTRVEPPCRSYLCLLKAKNWTRNPPLRHYGSFHNTVLRHKFTNH